MTHCTYPDCNCPFDAPADPNWCARGLPKSLEKIAERHLRQDLYLFGLKGLLADPAVLDHIPAVKALREENERLKNWRNWWCPDVCPITGLSFFMWITHHETEQWVPTYGGPYDSYTIPVRDEDGCYIRECYDHDLGGWRVGECEDVGLQVIDDQLYTSEEDPEKLKAQIKSLTELSDARLAWGQRLESQLAELRQGGEAVAYLHKSPDGSRQFLSRNPAQPVATHDDIDTSDWTVTPLFTRPQPAIPPGHVQVPDWHGYALLGTGRYILNASPPPMDPDLGAEFCITLATDEDRSDNRQIGEIRDNTRTTPYQPEEIAIRIGFLTPQALDAMEAQLTILRKDHWPETISPSVPVAEKDASEYQRGFKDGYQRRDDEVMGSLA